MNDPSDSTPRSIALRGKRSLSAVGNSLVSRGLQDLADLSAKTLLALIEDVRAAVSDREVSPDALAALVTKLTRAAIKNGFSEFAEYTAYADGMIDGVDFRLSKIGELIESAWRMLGQCEEYSHIDPAGNVAELCEQRLREQTETIYRRLRHSLLQEQAKSEDSSEGTHLHSAAEQGHAGTAEFLLSHGADVNARNEQGETPLDFASDDTIAQMLRQHGGVSGKDVQ